MAILHAQDVADQATVAKNSAQLRLQHVKSARSLDIFS